MIRNFRRVVEIRLKGNILKCFFFKFFLSFEFYSWISSKLFLDKIISIRVTERNSLDSRIAIFQSDIESSSTINSQLQTNRKTLVDLKKSIQSLKRESRKQGNKLSKTRFGTEYTIDESADHLDAINHLKNKIKVREEMLKKVKLRKEAQIDTRREMASELDKVQQKFNLKASECTNQNINRMKTLYETKLKKKAKLVEHIKILKQYAKR